MSGRYAIALATVVGAAALAAVVGAAWGFVDNRLDRVEARLSEAESCIKDDPRITTLAAHAIDAAERRCRTESRLRACETQLCSLTLKVETIGKKVVHTNGTVYVYDYLGSVMSKAFEGGAE